MTHSTIGVSISISIGSTLSTMGIYFCCRGPCSNSTLEHHYYTQHQHNLLGIYLRSCYLAALNNWEQLQQILPWLDICPLSIGSKLPTMGVYHLYSRSKTALVYHSSTQHQHNLFLLHLVLQPSC